MAIKDKKDLVDTVVSQLKGKDLSKQAVAILHQSTSRVLDRIKQNVDAQIKEDSSTIIEKFVDGASSKMSAMTQQWSDNLKNDFLIYPEGTRFVWRDGSTITIIVEQQPQVRHVNVYNEIFLLSMPYVQFILTFQNSILYGPMYVTCTKKPISDIDQAVSHLPLGNIDGAHSICMGNSKFQVDGNMTEQVDKFIGSFWQSQFTYDNASYLGAFMKKNFKTNGDSNDEKHEGFKFWQIETKNNALFATEKSTQYSVGSTFRKFLNSNGNDKNGSIAIVKNLKKEISSAVQLIGNEINQLLSDVDFKTENREKPHVQVLQETLKEIVVQSYAELWEYVQMQLVEERKAMKKENEDAILKLKEDFSFHMDKKNNTSW